jgi:hypothetical protein
LRRVHANWPAIIPQPWQALPARYGIRPAVPASHRARVARQRIGVAYRVFLQFKK